MRLILHKNRRTSAPADALPNNLLKSYFEFEKSKLRNQFDLG